jgi:hypothetical protein
MTKKGEAETWFAFTAPNRQSLYGYGTAQEAGSYCLQLNIRQDENFYCYHSIEAEGFSLAIALADMAEG